MKKNLKNKKSLNIAMLGHKRIPSREGGIEIVVEELATRMVTLGHKVTCYNRSGHHVSGKDFDGGKRKAYKGVRLKSVLTLDKKGLAAMTASVSGAICAAFGRYDVVHFHAEGPCAMLWLPKLFGKRCVATVHGLDHQRAKWGKLASTYIMMGEKCAVKFADEIIVLSKGVQDYFKETYGRETKFIPNRYANTSATSKNSRIDSLCQNLGVSDRRFSGDILEIQKDINYAEVTCKLKQLQKTTNQYIDTAFQGDI